MFIETMAIFLATLLAAALVALGAPGGAELAIVKAATAVPGSMQQDAAGQPR
jgi:hypothetical protein